MKFFSRFYLTVVIVAALFLLTASAHAQSAEGAWMHSSDNTSTVLIITPGYFSLTSFDVPAKKFLVSMGGRWTAADAGASVTIEFHTQEKEQVGKQYVEQVSLTGDKLTTVSPDGIRLDWKRIDEGKGALAGDWRISAREQDGKMNPINPGARKTVKILSGTRFQWIAINTSTGEFFGTGGGTYTFKDGIYTENIEFFSRDSSRVGASLSFKGKVTGNDWDHSGLSSKGSPIHEVWTRQ